MTEYRITSCPERTFYDATSNECLLCPLKCLKCIGIDGEKCVVKDYISFTEIFNDYWILLCLATVSLILFIIGCKYLPMFLFKPTIIREGNNNHSIDVEMKLHFAENPIANPYTYIVDYINA